MTDDKHPIQVQVDKQDHERAVILIDYYYGKNVGTILGQLFVNELRKLERQAAADIAQGITIPRYAVRPGPGREPD